MKALDLTNRFRREADAYYVEAKRSTVSSIAQIPVWMYGVLVVLGWNEAMTVLFNPLYFVTLLVGLVFAYVDPLFAFVLEKETHPSTNRFTIVRTNMVGPLFQVSRTIGNEVRPPWCRMAAAPRSSLTTWLF
jgi:hypothetical protein